jgi:hypothetical protein
LLSANNALQECHCGRIDPTSYLDQTLKDDKDKNHNRSNNAEIKTTAVKDSIENNKERKLNLEGRNQGTVSIEKKHKN